MRIAILGGGLTGLTAAYYLAKKGFLVTLFEKEKQFGGLASGFKMKNWQWYLDKTYHHLFTNDKEIINFSSEIGFKKIFFKNPETASLYKIENKKFKKQITNQNYLILPLDSPVNLLRFPFLNSFDKIRAGLVLSFLKISPYFSFYESITAPDFLKKTMGEKAYQILFESLFRKKFGKYAENILTPFFWARIKKRTKKLGYLEGGFQNFIDYLADKLRILGVRLLTGYAVNNIKIKKGNYLIDDQLFNVVISTLSTPFLIRAASAIFPADFLQNLRKIKYLHGLNLILESKTQFLEKTYWLNIATEKIPIMGVVEHTNFLDKKHYGGNHLLYLAWYLEENDNKLKMSPDQLLDYIFPYLNKINPQYTKTNLVNYFCFKTPFSQPIYNKDFIKNKPDFKTPLKNFYIANLEMTYPYDRGTNYAVLLGKKVSEIVFSENLR